jgi:hypothetical protein
MIRQIPVLYLAVVTLVIIGPNPLWILPLLLISASLITEWKWIGLLGILSYAVISLGMIDDLSMTDLSELTANSLAFLIPLIILLELVISEKPYRIEKISAGPVIKTLTLIAGFIITLLIVVRISRIGVYLNSDPMIQIFILMSLSILFSAPVLIGSLKRQSA